MPLAIKIILKKQRPEALKNNDYSFDLSFWGTVPFSLNYCIQEIIAINALSERQASTGEMGAQLKAPFNTTMLLWSKGFQGGPQLGPYDSERWQSLCCF